MLVHKPDLSVPGRACHLAIAVAARHILEVHEGMMGQLPSCLRTVMCVVRCDSYASARTASARTRTTIYVSLYECHAVVDEWLASGGLTEETDPNVEIALHPT